MYSAYWSMSIIISMDLFLSAIKSNDTFLTPYVSNRYVSQAIAYIQSHFRNQLTLAETAAHCAVSPEYLSRIFRKEMVHSRQDLLCI